MFILSSQQLKEVLFNLTKFKMSPEHSCSQPVFPGPQYLPGHCSSAPQKIKFGNMFIVKVK